MNLVSSDYWYIAPRQRQYIDELRRDKYIYPWWIVYFKLSEGNFVLESHFPFALFLPLAAAPQTTFAGAFISRPEFEARRGQLLLRFVDDFEQVSDSNPNWYPQSVYHQKVLF